MAPFYLDFVVKLTAFDAGPGSWFEVSALTVTEYFVFLDSPVTRYEEFAESVDPRWWLFR